MEHLASEVDNAHFKSEQELNILKLSYCWKIRTLTLNSIFLISK